MSNFCTFVFNNGSRCENLSGPSHVSLCTEHHREFNQFYIDSILSESDDYVFQQETNESNTGLQQLDTLETLNEQFYPETRENSQILLPIPDEAINIFCCCHYSENDCDICTEENQIIVSMSCCLEKQSMCIKCFISILVQKMYDNYELDFNLLQINPGFIFECYWINCPFCRQKCRLFNCNYVIDDLITTLHKVVFEKFNVLLFSNEQYLQDENYNEPLDENSIEFNETYNFGLNLPDTI
jgi:hypothetical protein